MFFSVVVVTLGEGEAWLGVGEGVGAGSEAGAKVGARAASEPSPDVNLRDVARQKQRLEDI